ncbi:MAG: hypothetical protein JJU29_18250 [Verrucomicrobia bacterium]|nr:hypothetical protein [Verrucomicrobiota bacterium]MCH8514010.1 hypothetical protein [Kiritimatiellia bacterium]
MDTPPDQSNPDPAPAISEDEANLAVADRPFKYYIFDWDNNILHMPTRIHLEHRTESGDWEHLAVSTSFYSVVRNDRDHYRPPDGDWESAFREFRDFANEPESQFLVDTKTALAPVIAGEQEGGPSFRQFRQALIEGRLFAIVTARGHQSTTIRAGVEYFIANVLDEDERAEMMRNLRGYRAVYERDENWMTDEEVLKAYLDLNRYHAVTSPEFRAFMGANAPGVDIQEEAKQFAIMDFIRHVFRIVRRSGVDKPISVGFSDDDPRNVRAVETFIEQELHREFPQVKFVVYDTSDPEVPDGRKIVVSGQLEFDFD